MRPNTSLIFLSKTRSIASLSQGARDACYLFEDRLCEMSYYADDNAAPANQQKAAVRGNICRFVETVDGRSESRRAGELPAGSLSVSRSTGQVLRVVFTSLPL